MNEWIRFTRYARTRPSLVDDGGRVVSYEVCHTYECRAELLLWRIAQRRARARYPGLCLRCGGSGGTMYHFKPDSGPGYLQDWDDCPDCLGQGYCPRCGADWLAHFEGNMDSLDDHQIYGRPCPLCGYKWAHGDGEVIPERPDCLCYYELAMEG